MCSFLQKNDIYEEIQSGFRPHHSTETALVKITNDLLLALDQGCIALIVLLDLSATFHTIDNDILIDRLQNYTGIQGQALRWFCHRTTYHNHRTSHLATPSITGVLSTCTCTCPQLPVYYKSTLTPLDHRLVLRCEGIVHNFSAVWKGSSVGRIPMELKVR